MNNKYYNRFKISEKKFRQLLRYFVIDFTATDTAQLTGFSRRSVTTIYGRLRQKIAWWCKQTAPIQGTLEVDEYVFWTYLCLQQTRTKRWYKIIAFGIFKHKGGGIY